MAKPILIYNAINSEFAKEYTEKILAIAENETIDVWLNTPGGTLNAGWSMLAASNKRNKINATVTGDASSFGFYYLLFTNYNKAFDTSNFLIHRAASMWEDYMNEDELKEIEARNKIIRRKLEARIDEDAFTKVTKKTFDDIFSMEGQLDVRLSANQAKKIGLIDEVVKLNVEKRAEIEAQYFNDIAALATPQTQITNTNTNTNNNNMGKLADLIFGEKDSILLAQIGESQFAYSKIELGAKIKATGEGEKLPVTGTFEANDKLVTVVDNEITAITDLDNKQKEIDALKTELSAIKENQITVEDVADVIAKLQEKQASEISALKEILTAAKLSVSTPKLPEGEFSENKVVDSKPNAYKIQKEIEAKAKAKQELRDKQIKGGI